MREVGTMLRTLANLAVTAAVAVGCSTAPPTTGPTVPPLTATLEPTHLVVATTAPTATPLPVPVVAMPGPLDAAPEGAIVFYRTDDARLVDTQFIIDAGGSNERLLSPALANVAVSPDGQWLAFSWGDWDSGRMRPAVMRLDGGGFRVLDPDPDRVVRLQVHGWSGDGERLYVRLLEGPGTESEPARDLGLSSVRVADGDDLRSVFPSIGDPNVGELYLPAPDGRRLLHNEITGRPQGDLNILSLARLGDSKEVRVSPAEGDITVVDLQFYDGTSEDWAPDGSTFVFCVVNTTNGDSGMQVVDSSGRNVKTLIEVGFGAVSARYSPDGSKIAFTAEQGPDDQVWVMDADGSNRKQLTFGADGSVSVLPLWSPDGRHLVFQRRVDPYGPITLWRIDADGNNLFQLSPTPLAKQWVGGYVWLPAPPP